MVKRQAIGFWRGFTAPFGAASSLLGQPRAWPFALVPVVVFALIEAAFIALAWQQIAPWLTERYELTSVYSQRGVQAVSVLLMGAVGWIAGMLLAPPVSAPALERIVLYVEEELGAPARPALGFFAELWCGLQAMLWGSLFTLPLLAVLTLLELVFPPSAVVATPLKLLIGALGQAFCLFDYPLTLRGVGARDRLAFMRRNFSVVLGFGTAFTLVFWLPCCAVVMLPVGVAAATRLYWAIERQLPPPHQ
jgi:CysZ protein